MSDKPEWAIKIKRTITVTQTITSRSYPGDTQDQAIAWELERDKVEKIQSFVEALEYVPDIDIEFTETVEPVQSPEG